MTRQIIHIKYQDIFSPKIIKKIQMLCCDWHFKGKSLHSLEITLHYPSLKFYLARGPASMAQFVACPTGDQEVMGLTPPSRQHSGMEIEHEISSVVILCLLLIQEGQFFAKECAQYWLIRL